MRMHSNTILITSGSSGIGKGLAEAFHKLGNQVIISGRREGILRDICTANPGMRWLSLDVMDPSSVLKVAAEVIKEFPKLNCVFNNTKAAVHSSSLSLRHQLKGCRVELIELIPPYVETELGGVTKDPGNSGGPKPMPLDAFIAETMKELAGDADEVAIANAKTLMGASGLETVKKAIAVMNR